MTKKERLSFLGKDISCKQVARNKIVLTSNKTQKMAIVKSILQKRNKGKSGWIVSLDGLTFLEEIYDSREKAIKVASDNLLK